MNKQGISSFRRVWNALFYSIDGLITCYKTEQAFRQELLLCALLCPVPFLLDLSVTSRGLMLLCLVLILIAELVNSALEALADQISTDHHELIKKAKDAGSAIVFLCLILTGIVWAMIIFS